MNRGTGGLRGCDQKDKNLILMFASLNGLDNKHPRPDGNRDTLSI